MGAELVEEELEGSNIDQLPYVPSVILLMCVNSSLCSRHVLCRCSAMFVATGRSLGVCIVFWPVGLVDNLHPVAIECDSASQHWALNQKCGPLIYNLTHTQSEVMHI